MQPERAQIEHLYVHVPFCPTICPFCSFHVVRRRDELVAAYLERLDAELAAIREAWPDAGALRSVYLGGGTPTHLDDDELAQLVTSIRRRFDVSGDAEIGLEAHPLNVADGRPLRWRAMGFTRVSVGVQSTQDPVLRALGRPHSAAEAMTALERVLSVDDWTVNADLIVAAPRQDVAADLHRLAATGVHHLAAYTLTIEDGTPFARRGVTVDEEHERAALEQAAQILPEYGLFRYEVSNHARPGHRCQHNLAYWRGRYWFGAGPSATARLPGPSDTGLLVRNPALDRWLASAPAEVEVLDVAEQVRVRLLTGLRLAEGVELDALLTPLAATGEGAAQADELRRRVAALRATGRLAGHAGRLVVPPAELLVLDRLLAELW